MSALFCVFCFWVCLYAGCVCMLVCMLVCWVCVCWGGVAGSFAGARSSLAIWYRHYRLFFEGLDIIVLN